MIHIDGFLDSYQDLKNYMGVANFGDVVNPIDGAVYPYICAEIPGKIKAEVLGKISSLIGREPVGVTMFLRKSPSGVSVPHIAHTDISMGTTSLMLYCNDHELGGTAMLRHKKTGICYSPEDQEYVDLMIEDQNNPEAWAILDMINMKENRAAIFDAGKFHCAMPIGGFGENDESRVVLTVFFS